MKSYFKSKVARYIVIQIIKNIKYEAPYISYMQVCTFVSIIHYTPLSTRLYIAGARDSTLGLMCVVIVAAVPTTVIYSIYVATEAARYRCMILTIMCFTFFAGKIFLNALNTLMLKRRFKMT